MKILVVSDSHGNTEALLKAAELARADMILHLGDHDRDCAVLRQSFPDIMIRAVRGNCDRSSNEAAFDEFVVEDKRIFMVHGDEYGVKYSLSSLLTAALYRNADIVLFGHTHRQLADRFEGMLVMNPGSVGMGRKTYAVLYIEYGTVRYELFELPAE